MRGKTPPPPIRPLVTGNWKMNGTGRDVKQLRALLKGLSGKIRYSCDVMVCPPTTLLSRLADLKPGRMVQLGGQDCHAADNGAHTGDISVEMLKEAKASAVIVGHSERRTDYAETDKMVRTKVSAVHRASLTAIICVGESLKQRKAGDTIKTVDRQLRGSLPDDCTAANTVVAYEPVWAIGSGLVPTPEQIGEVHLALRKALIRRFGAEGQAVRLLYGGSVKPDNAAQLMAVTHVNGALVGGASLTAKNFLGIIAAYAR